MGLMNTFTEKRPRVTCIGKKLQRVTSNFWPKWEDFNFFKKKYGCKDFKKC